MNIKIDPPPAISILYLSGSRIKNLRRWVDLAELLHGFTVIVITMAVALPIGMFIARKL
jgi:hypothetical protein